jgi:hypothetical protein
MTQSLLDDLGKHMAGKPMKGEVDLTRLDVMA